jgi:hypothetical protein
MAKDEDDMGSEATPCTTCGGPLQLLGPLGNREHSICRNCGMSHSRDISAEPGMAGASTDDPMAKEEIAAVKAAPEKTAPGAEVPDGPGKEIEAEGSGSDPKKGKMAKGDTWNPATGAADEQHVRGSVAAKMGAGTPPKKSAKDLRGTPESKIKPLAKGAMPGLGTANPPAQKARILDRFRLGQGGTPAGSRVPLPGITAPVRAPGTPPPLPAAAMKKPSVVSKLHGSKLAGPTSPGQANAEVGRFQSLAGSPTHLAAMGKGEEKPEKKPFDAKKWVDEHTTGADFIPARNGAPEPKRNGVPLDKAGLPAAPKAPSMPTAAAPAAGAKNTIAAAAGAKPPSVKPAK